jgi:hypothetical protein
MAQTVCILLNATDRQRLEQIAGDRNRPLKHVQRAVRHLRDQDGGVLAEAQPSAYELAAHGRAVRAADGFDTVLRIFT